MRYVWETERRNGLKNILNKYLGQTILPKIFPLQGWCRGNFFPSSISDPILTNIGQIPQLHQNIGGGASLTQWKQNMIFTITASHLSSPLSSACLVWLNWSGLTENNIKGNQLNCPANKKSLDKHCLSAEAGRWSSDNVRLWDPELKIMKKRRVGGYQDQ